MPHALPIWYVTSKLFSTKKKKKKKKKKSEMRPMKMRNGDKVGSHDPQSLADVQNLWNQWEIHCLIVASFALQVFLFSTAGLRLRSSSRVVGVLLWLGYMSADSVAVFVLGHLSVHTAGGHQLLLFWAPFVLLHLGGQDTITAFSMQDNALWMRHLLGFASQLAVAVFVVSKSPWPDRRLLAAMLLMFLSACIKYGERIYCLATANPERLMKEFLRGFEDRIRSIKEMQAIAREGLGSYLSSRTFTEVSLNPAMDIMSTDILPNYDWSVSRDVFSDLYSKQIDPSTPQYRRNAYFFAEDRLWVCYQRLYTKAVFRLSPAGALLHLLGFLSTSAAMALFFMAGKSGYGGADVAVSTVLLVGAVTLEATSFVMSMFSREDLWRHPLCCSGKLPVIHCVFFITCGTCADSLRRRWRRPQWSKTLTQYSIIQRSVKRASGSSMVPRWVVERLSPSASGVERIPVADDLKHLVVKKLLDDKMMATDFTSSRGEVALGRRWADQQPPESLSLSEKVLSESVKEVDFPTSVLIWHIATDIRFFTDAAGEASADRTIISRQLSGYIMYLIFKCGVMLSSNSKFLLRKAGDEITALVKAGRRDDRDEQHDGSSSRGKKAKGIAMAVQHLVGSPLFAQARSSDTVPANPSTADILGDPVLPRAFRVAESLAGVPEADRWGLIVDVWLEMLYYIAPRCGAAFHREHLSTGGEFITHVLVVMYTIGPLGYHPSLLKFGPH
ncbi:hypothetical protein CFC21_077942 [Triticum aestivum]|uniref:DUF4220 domain-containing protein n=5 Tax=Triticinae TaxID=1648030 RepID=A0A9R1L0C0_WHEAT|nr:uncharacterized protein LOC120963988 [Aegilops tauschii subsp. strangulata]KAF7072863.1 hypothetical protein CFC21_077940 [Triticum aestivum]KAF7072865.1 hypothetical protein CFC21_077942 [Triticum aestivum]